MGELLLITDDLCRAKRIARDFDAATASHIHDLYSDKLPATRPELIVSDIEALTSDAIVRLRRILGQVRDDGIPFPFLVHGNAARVEAQARVLGATTTTRTQDLLGALASMQLQIHAIPIAAREQAAEVRQFFERSLFSGKPITRAVADTGTDMVARAVSESGIRDWIRAVQLFDDATHQHCLLVAALGAAFSGALGLCATDRHLLTKAALLHDVGKIHVRTAILNKPGKLAEAEMAVMRTHPVQGYAMLVGQGFEDEILAVVRSHHEMLDGCGYPDGLRGKQIPDLVRLVTICDVYGALIERRPYRPSMAGERAYSILESMVSQLDGDLVRAFRPVAAAFDPSIQKAT